MANNKTKTYLVTLYTYLVIIHINIRKYAYVLYVCVNMHRA